MASLREYFYGYEFRRKLFHVLVGLTAAIALRIHYDKILALTIILGIIILGLACSIVVKYHILRFVRRYLALFDKPSDIERFPGKGSIYYLMGMLCAILFFEQDVAIASILILAIGDPISYTIGRYYGKTKLVINPKKLLEGTVAGIICSTIAASFIVPMPLAFFGASFAMIAEAIELEYTNLDDNFFIPIVAGIVITAIQAAL